MICRGKRVGGSVRGIKKEGLTHISADLTDKDGYEAPEVSHVCQAAGGIAVKIVLMFSKALCLLRLQ